MHVRANKFVYCFVRFLPFASTFVLSSFFFKFNLFIIKIKSDRSMRLHFISCIKRTRQSYLRTRHHTNVRSNCEYKTPSVDRSTVLISSDDDHMAKRERKIWNIGLTGFITHYFMHSQKSRQRSIRDIEITYVQKFFFR